MLKAFLTKYVNKGGTWEPAINRNGYPYDFHPAMRIMRLGDGPRNQPYPVMLGSVGINMPMLNAVNVAGGVGPKPSGPGVNVEPVNLQYQVAVPGLSKVAT